MAALSGQTTTAGAVFIPEIWSKNILLATENNLVAANCVERYDGEVSEYGDIIRIPNIDNLAVTAVTELDEVNYQTATEGQNTITIDKYYESSLLISDKLNKQSKYSLGAKYQEKCGYAVAKQVDSDVLGLYSGLSQDVGTGSTAISEANMLIANRYLDVADAPSSERYFIVNSYGKHDILGIDNFIRYEKTGKGGNASPLYTGLIGELYGVQIYISNNVPTVATSPVTAHGLFFQKEAFGLAMQMNPKVEKSRIPERLADLCTTQVLYGVGELRDTFAVDYYYNNA